MLEPKPEDRYQTADEFSRAIDAALPMTSSAADRDEETRYIAPALAKNPIREFTTPGGSAQESLDRKFGAWTTRTIAGSGNIEMQDAARPRTNVTAVPFERKTAVPLERRTITSRPSTEATRVLATPAPALPPPRRKTWPYALAAAVMLGVAVAAVLLHRRPPEPTKLVPNPVTTVSAPPTATATPATPSAPPPIAKPPEASATPTPSTVTRPPKETHPVKPVKPIEHLASASQPAQTLTVPVPVPPPPPTMPRVEAPPQPYCVNKLPTTFFQAKTQGNPEGFASEKEFHKTAKPDSGRLRVEIRVSPDPPIENKPFEVVASFVNKGDLDRTVSLVEESVPRTKGGFLPISGVSLPARVESGGALAFYRFSGVLSGRFVKDLRVTDLSGDSWQSSVRVEPCD